MSYPFRKIYLVIALTLVTSVIFAFDLHAAENKKNHTISSEDVFQEQIQKSSPLSYEQIRALFESNPSYIMNCVPSTTTLFSPSSEGLELFKAFAPGENPSLNLNFALRPNGDGFNIYLSRDDVKEFSKTSNLLCEKTKDSQCSNLNITEEKKVPFHREGYGPDAIIKERFAFSTQANGAMYAIYEFAATAMENNLWGRPTHKKSLELKYVCKLSLVLAITNQAPQPK